jgi:hypothetical protein
MASLLPSDVCVLVRLHPFSGPDDVAVLNALSRVSVIVPGRSDRYVERVMGEEDERHLARQLSLAVGIVSMASTISIDALCLERSVLNVAFDPRPGLPWHQSVRRFYRFNHFRDLVALVGLPLAEDLEQVDAYVEACLRMPLPSARRPEAFSRWYVPPWSHRYPTIVAATIKECANGA